ncbi:MAG: polyprenyl synthetase family protein, partial [Mesorhizobium sp.]
MQTGSTLHDDRTGFSALGGLGAQARGASGRLLPEIWMQDGVKRVE